MLIPPNPIRIEVIISFCSNGIFAIAILFTPFVTSSNPVIKLDKKGLRFNFKVTILVIIKKQLIIQ